MSVGIREGNGICYVSCTYWAVEWGLGWVVTMLPLTRRILQSDWDPLIYFFPSSFLGTCLQQLLLMCR